MVSTPAPKASRRYGGGMAKSAAIFVRVWRIISHISTSQWLIGLIAPSLTIAAVLNWLSTLPVELVVLYGVLGGCMVFITALGARQILKHGKANTPEAEEDGARGAPPVAPKLASPTDIAAGLNVSKVDVYPK